MRGGQCSQNLITSRFFTDFDALLVVVRTFEASKLKHLLNKGLKKKKKKKDKHLNRSANHFTLRCYIEQNPYKVSVLQPILYEDRGTSN